jgi:hypothetical protein
MSWEELGALGELVGALASVVLLVYIAVQIRHSSKSLEHNTRATEAASRQAFSAQDQAYLSSALDSSILAQALAKHELGDPLSSLEHSQLVGRQHLNFRVFETGYSQFQRGILEQSEWQRYERIIQFLMHTDEPSREMWQQLGELFDPEFVAEVERLASVSSSSIAALQADKANVE